MPEPLGLIPEQRMVLFRHVAARPLSDLTGLEALAGVRRAGQWLARLHTSQVRLPRALSLEEEARSSRQWAAFIGRTHPTLGTRADRLATNWRTAVVSDSPSRQVPIHKDFHAGHVLLDEDVCVIDLDEARQGDPTFDVAHFCTYLQAVEDCQDSAPVRDAFLEAYSDATDWVDDGSFGPYAAYTWLKVAKQRAAGRGPFAPVAAARRQWHVERAIAAGERCLGR